MKATFILVSEGGKIAVSGERKPDNWHRNGPPDFTSKEKAMQSFSDSFIVVENPELVLNNAGKFFKPDQYKVMGREVPKVEDGLYPIQGLEFEVNQQCLVDGDWIDFDKMTVTKEAKFKRKVAIVSLVEPSKEVHYSENPELGGRFTERLGEKTAGEFFKEYFKNWEPPFPLNKDMMFLGNTAHSLIYKVMTEYASLKVQQSRKIVFENNKPVADHVNETFAGLNDLIPDTEVVWWYKELITQTVHHYVLQEQSKVLQALNDGFVAGRSKQSFEDFKNEWLKLKG